MNERSFRVYLSCTKFNDDYFFCDYYDIDPSTLYIIRFGTEEFSSERLHSAVKKYSVRTYNGKVSNGVVVRHYTDVEACYVMASINAPVSALRAWVFACYPNFARFERCDWVIPCGRVFDCGFWVTSPTKDTKDTKDTTEDTITVCLGSLDDIQVEENKPLLPVPLWFYQRANIYIWSAVLAAYNHYYYCDRRKRVFVKPIRISPHGYYPVRVAPYGMPADYYPYKMFVDGLEIWDCRSCSYNEYLSDLIGAPPYDELPF